MQRSPDSLARKGGQERRGRGGDGGEGKEGIGGQGEGGSSSSSSDRVDSRGPLSQPRVATTTGFGPFGTAASLNTRSV